MISATVSSSLSTDVELAFSKTGLSALLEGTGLYVSSFGTGAKRSSPKETISRQFVINNLCFHCFLLLSQRKPVTMVLKSTTVSASDEKSATACQRMQMYESDLHFNFTFLSSRQLFSYVTLLFET